MTRVSNRIFVVDDEPVIALTLAAILRQNGFEVRSYTNPLEAQTGVEDGVPDLLLTDVMMPQLSGIELAVRFREKFPDCRVLLLSGHAKTSDLVAGARTDGHRFELLAKPIEPENLLAEILRALA